MSAVPLFLREDFRQAVGPALRPGGLGLTARALALCGLPAGAMIADLGCGCGASLALLAQGGFRAVGVDRCSALLAQAATLAPKAALACGDIRNLPLASRSCDAVLCECVLSVTGHAEAAFSGIRRILRPGGFFACSDVYLRTTPGVAAQRAVGCPAGAVSRQQLEAFFARSGLTVRLFEDHSGHLAQLAGQLLFAGFSREALGACGHNAGKPGYYLCIAQAEDQ